MQITQGTDTSALCSTPQSCPFVSSALVQNPLWVPFPAVFSFHLDKGLGQVASFPLPGFPPGIQC